MVENIGDCVPYYCETIFREASLIGGTKKLPIIGRNKSY
jgi:hypothetical protein